MLILVSTSMDYWNKLSQKLPLVFSVLVWLKCLRNDNNGLETRGIYPGRSPQWKTNCAIQRTKFSNSKTDFVSIMTYFASRGNLELIKITKPCKFTD